MRIGVLGAGPGAGAAALRLARDDADVTVFRPDRPGEKPCGGALPTYLLGEVEGFACDVIPRVESPRAVVENASSGQVELSLPGLRIFRRRDLDPALIAGAEAAGAEVVSERATTLDFGPRGVRVSSASGQREFDWLIAADGARGLGRRSLALPPGAESVGLGASLKEVEVDKLVLSFPDVADAYLWIFPRPGGCSVGIAWSSGSLSDGAARGLLDDLVQRHVGAPLEDLTGPRYRYPIPTYSSSTLTAIRRGLRSRVLLVGDAAGVADPLTREGIRYAMRTGRWAAEALLDDPFSYFELARQGLEADLGRAEAARQLFFETPMGQWMVPVCRWHAGIRAVLADLLTCDQPYTGLRHRLLAAALRPRLGYG